LTSDRVKERVPIWRLYLKEQDTGADLHFLPRGKKMQEAAGSCPLSNSPPDWYSICQG